MDRAVEELIKGNTAFAFDLYHALGREGNLFFSPFSISLALAMTYAGACGETERQMAEVLHFPPRDQTHGAMALMATVMKGRAHGAGTKEEGGVSLDIANALWGRKGYKFLQEFLCLLLREYGAGLKRADFSGNPQGAADAINGWGYKQTRGMIKKVLSAEDIPALTKLILANAVYFDAAWQYKFNKKLTRNRSFYLSDGSEVKVPMMEWDEGAKVGYDRGPGYQAVELPYDGEELSMVILLPDPGAFREFEASLGADRMGGILSGLRKRDVQLVMPKFKLEWGAMLKEVLTKMGMGIAFSNDADFSGMDGSKYLTIDQVVHKARTDVDEDGTRAAAITTVLMRGKGAGDGPTYMKVDRPFISLIRDVAPGTILFMGRVINPAA